MASLVALRSQGSSSSWAGTSVYLRSSSSSSKIPFARVPNSPRIFHDRRYNFQSAALQRSLGARPLASLSASILGSDPFSTRFHQYPNPSGTKESTSSSILACSSNTLDQHRENFLRRLLKWLQRTAQSCWEALLVSIRGTEIIFRLSPLLIMAPASIFADQFLKQVAAGHNNIVSDVTWWYVTDTMQALGPAFVKLCQWAATRRDIFPSVMCDRLQELQSSGNPHSWAGTHAALQEAFGADYAENGLIVNSKTKVLGCGSAAQVYEGSLLTTDKETGETERRSVAIKVLHPKFEVMVERDLWFMQSVANMLHSLPVEHIKMLNLPRASINFGSILRRQADLRIEAENLQQFRANFYRDEKDEETSAILFPRPVEGWISHSVLVEELFGNCRSIAEFINDGSTEGHTVRKELAGPLLRAFLKMVFLDNFVHCDLHAGNVLVLESTVPHKPSLASWWGGKTDAEPLQGDEETKRTIVFLDAGIAVSLDPEDRKNLRDLFRAVIMNKGDEAGRLMVERAKYERCSQVEGGVDAFAKGIDELVGEFHDRRKEGLTLGAVRIGSLLSRVLELCRVHGVEIDPSMASIVISTLVLEGLGRSLEPSLNLMDFAVPFVLGRGRV